MLKLSKLTNQFAPVVDLLNKSELDFSGNKNCLNIHKIVSQLMSTRKAYTLMNKKKMSVPISHSPLQNKYWISRFNHTCKPKMLG
jgi:hypothetical protein